MNRITLGIISISITPKRRLFDAITKETIVSGEINLPSKAKINTGNNTNLFI